MDVNVGLSAIAVSLLAGCGGSAIVTAIFDPPIPNAAQPLPGRRRFKMDSSSRVPCCAWWSRALYAVLSDGQIGGAAE